MINFFNILPIKKLTISLQNSSGRNSRGKITSYHRGGGVKKRYRVIDFKRTLSDIPGFVRRIEFDPIRNSYIALVCYANGILSYILAVDGMKIGFKVFSSNRLYSDFTVGSSLLLKSFPIGSFIHNIELNSGKGGQLCRAAGSYA